jgi:hypothetical protein
LLGNWSGRRGSNPQLSAWEFYSSSLYFQYLQNGSGKINVHALHTGHALPDLRIAGGGLRDGLPCVASARPREEFVNGERLGVFQESRL